MVIRRIGRRIHSAPAGFSQPSYHTTLRASSLLPCSEHSLTRPHLPSCIRVPAELHVLPADQAVHAAGRGGERCEVLAVRNTAGTREHGYDGAQCSMSAFAVPG